MPIIQEGIVGETKAIMETQTVILTLGVMFIVGLTADQIGRRTSIPRVTLLLLCGLLAGHFGWIPERVSASYEFLSITALSFVAFLLGGSLKLAELKQHGARIITVSLAIVAVTVVIVSIGLILMGVDPALAVILSAIATATAPAATTDVIRQSGIDNGFTRTLQGIVAIDDAWGLLVFSICLGLVAPDVSSHSGIPVVWEIGGAVLLGLAVGLPGAVLTGRIKEGEPLEIEALALIFLTTGIALYAEVSFLIAGMTAGAIIANLAKHHDRAFHEVEHIQWPYMALFFLLAGSTLELKVLLQVGGICAAFVILRTGARTLGGWLGAWISGAAPAERRLYGLALMPQAGVAVGMALVAATAMPEFGEQIIALTIGSTIVFEVFGPILTLWAVRRASDN